MVGLVQVSHLKKLKSLINKINSYRDEFGTLDHPNYQFQVMGEAAYSPDGSKTA